MKKIFVMLVMFFIVVSADAKIQKRSLIEIGPKVILYINDEVDFGIGVEAAALLHDLGKIGVDEELLLKPGKLSKNEKTEIENHALRGYYILLGFEELERALEGVRNHHEHYNGSGYPNGLTEDKIPLIGRIIAVADAFDAMTSERPYRKAKTKPEAIEELKRFAGKQFDPKIVDVFIKTFED